MIVNPDPNPTHNRQISVKTRITDKEVNEYSEFLSVITNNRSSSNDKTEHKHSLAVQTYQYMVAMICDLLGSRSFGPESKCITLKFEFLVPINHDDEITTRIGITSIDKIKRLTTVEIDCQNQEACQVITGQAVLFNAA